MPYSPRSRFKACGNVCDGSLFPPSSITDLGVSIFFEVAPIGGMSFVRSAAWTERFVHASSKWFDVSPTKQSCLPTELNYFDALFDQLLLTTSVRRSDTRRSNMKQSKVIPSAGMLQLHSLISF